MGHNRKSSFTSWAVAFCAPFVLGITHSAGPTAAAFAYVANNGSNTVSAINAATNTVVATVAEGSGPSAVAVSPDGTRAYEANSVSWALDFDS